MLLVETFPVGAFACNCTILGDSDSKQAVVIDPGGDVQRIGEVLMHHGLTVTSIIHTHAHIDHIFATRQVKETHGGNIGLHQEDLFLYDGIGMQAALFGWQAESVLPVDRFLQDGDVLSLGRKQLLVIHTPGHTPGSICFHVPEASLLFSGDTLFQHSIGRTDLWGGDSKQIIHSIKTKLYKLDPATQVVPGHGPNTSVAEEAEKNPFVRAS